MEVRGPDFILSVLDDSTGNRNKAGAGWITYDETGSVKHISIKLAAGVVLRWDDCLLKTLFVSENLSLKKIDSDSRTKSSNGFTDFTENELTNIEIRSLESCLNRNLTVWERNFVKTVLGKQSKQEPLTKAQLKSAKKVISKYE